MDLGLAASELRSLLTKTEPAAIMEATVDAVVGLVAPAHVGFYLYDEASAQLVLAARNTSDSPGVPLGFKLRRGEGPIGKALGAGRARHESYVQPGAGPPDEGAATHPGVAPRTLSHLIVPLTHRGAPVGVLELQSPHAGSLEGDIPSMLTIIAQHAARSLGNALNHRNDAVRSRLANTLLETAVTGALLVDRGNRVRHASGRLLSMLGLEPGPHRRGLVGRTYSRSFWPRLAVKLQQPSRYPPGPAAREASAGHEIEEDICLSGPADMVLHRRCVPVRDDQGEYAGRVEIYEDVTAERRAASHLHAAASIARVLTATFDLPRILAGLARGLAAAVDYDAAVCYIRGTGGTITVASLDPRRPDTPELVQRIEPAKGYDGWCSDVGPAVMSELRAMSPLSGPAADLCAMGMEQACILPIAAGESDWGTLAVGLARAVPRYSQATLETLIPLAEFLSLGINNAMLFEEVRRSGEAAREEAAWSSALLDMARAVASSHGPHETCSAGADVLRRLFDPHWVLITLYDRTRQVFLVGHASCGRGRSLAVGPELGPAAAALVQSAVAAAGVLTLSGLGPASEVLPEAGSLAVAPLCSGDELAGGIILGFSHSRGLAGGRERAILLGLANQMALGIKQAALLAAAKQQADLLAGISRASRRLTSSLDPDVVLDEVTGFLSRDRRLDWVGVFLQDKATGDLVLRAQSGPFAHYAVPGERIPSGRGLVGAAAREGKPLVVNDVTTDPRYVDLGVPGLATQSEMCVPIMFDDHVLGVLNVESTHKNAFGERDLLTVQTLSDHLAIAINNAQLYQHIRRLHLATTQSLVRAMEARDPYARGHGARVSEYAVAIACRLGLNTGEVEQLRLAGLLHDVGKVVVEDRVLAKRGPLDSVERALVMEHSIAGAGILRRTEALAGLAPLVRSHHEWYGGGGYPDGITGDDIPFGARILAVADAFDAMTSDRPYRTALPVEEALDRLRAGENTQFDPAPVSALLEVIDEAKRCGDSLWRDLVQRVEASRQASDTPAAGHGAHDQPGRILPVHGRALHVMYRVSLETGSILQPRQLLQRILGILHDTMGQHRYAILLTEVESGDLLVEADVGRDGKLHGYRVPAGKGVTGWVAEHGVPLLVKDVENDPRYIAGPSEGMRSELAVPLIARGRVIGVLDIESEVPNAFTAEDIYLLTAVAGQVSTAIEVSQQHEQVAKAAIVDGLTGLYNHSYFYSRLEEEIARSRRHGRPLVVGLADVDRLKAINDQYGHLAGDAALREIAACLRSKLRRTDIIARYGGDEFGLVMPETDLADADIAAQRFRAELRGRRIRVDRHEIAVPTVALGLAAFPLEGDSPAMLVSRADEKLYIEKRSNRSACGPPPADRRMTRTA